MRQTDSLPIFRGLRGGAMFQSITLLSVLILCSAGVRAAEEEASESCAETDFACIQDRETSKFETKIDEQKEVWLGRWEDAKKRGTAMMREHKLSCGELSGMERMKCRIEAAKKLKEWKENHETKKDEYLERMKKLKDNFLEKQKDEDSLWSKVKNDYGEKAMGIKDQLLNGDTIESFLGPSDSGESLEGRVNAALTKGAGSVSKGADFVKEKASHYEKLQKDRDACRSSKAVSSCLEQVGVDHDKWKKEFETRKTQVQEAATNLKLPTGN